MPCDPIGLVGHGYTGSSASLGVASYEYNALHWRTVGRTTLAIIGDEGDGPPGVQRLLYYSAAWQLLEERIDEDFNNAPGTNRIAQEVWGVRYLDDPVLRRQYDPTAGDAEDLLHYHPTCSSARWR